MFMKTRFLSLLALSGVLGGTTLIANALETPSVQANVNVSAAPAAGASRYSGRINEVVALAQSGVDQNIVMSFIKTSPGPFQPSADEIIKLRDAGVSSDVITAMMQRGAELRDQAVASAAQAQQSYYAQSPTTYTQPTQAAPVQAQSWPPQYVDPTYYPSTYYSAPSTVTYIGGSYGYPYNYYYPFSYNYYRPYYRPSYSYYHPYSYPRVGFNFRVGAPFRGGFHGNIGGGFHGGVHGGGGFHGGGGSHGGGGHGGGHH